MREFQIEYYGDKAVDDYGLLFKEIERHGLHSRYYVEVVDSEDEIIQWFEIDHDNSSSDQSLIIAAWKYLEEHPNTP